MIRFVLLLLALLAVEAGCTAQSLRRNTIRQTNTWVDAQYRQVMENLAMVASNPDVLPCFTTLDTGVSDVSDTVTITGGLTIPPLGGSTTGLIDPGVKRQIKDNWNLTQVTGPEKIRAMSLALRFAISNDPYLLIVHDHGVSLDAFCFLRGQCPCMNPPTACVRLPMVECRKCDPCNRDYPGEPGYYFNVKYDLERLPAGWVHVGTKKQVPDCAAYTGFCGDTYVWVTDQDMGALSQFTLTLLRIAHEVLWQAYFPYPDMIAVPVPDDQQMFALNCSKCATLHPPEPLPPPPKPGEPTPPPPPKPVKAQVVSIIVPVDAYGNVVIVKDRIDSLYTSDTKVKTAVAAAIKGP